ncbi:MAG: ATP-binding protein, partial [Pseudomonadota bacterium]|nr:ATP-binding protein [Pseudomonadota bacterium]
ESLGITTLSGFLILLPALLGGLFWPRANDIGCLFSLAVGALCWLLIQVLPYHTDWLIFARLIDTLQLSRLESGVACLLVASIALGLGSLLRPQTQAEQVRALECAVYDPEPILRVQRWDIRAAHVDDIEHALSKPLGAPIAAQQVQQALAELDMSWDETRPNQLTRLRERLNFNLSALLGPAVSQDILDRVLPYHARLDLPQIVVRHALEQRLDHEQSTGRLSGTAAELDALRRFHRQMLHELPIGVCSVNAQLTIMSWNRMMGELTGFGDEVVGWRISDIPNVWGSVLMQFMADSNQQAYRQTVQYDGYHYLVNLQRATVGEPDGQNQVLVIEDVTQMAELEKQLTHQDRLAAIGRLVAGVAHEIGNPVTGIAGLAQNLEDDFEDPEIQDASQKILEQTERIRNIVNALVGYARTDRLDQAQQQTLCLRDLVNEAMSLTRMGQRKSIRFINAVEADLHIAGYGPQLHQVFINLFGNAIDASADAAGQTESIRIHVSAHQNNQHIHIEIEDDGHGLPNGELRSKLFEPFVTTKQYGQGTGLGLSLVQGIISSHGGRIQLIDKTDYDQGRGVIVQISLPVIQPAEEHT